MKKVALLHYLPLEYYPPVVNLLDIVSSDDFNFQIHTTHNIQNRKVYNNYNFKIYRSGLPNPNENSLIKLMKYIIYNMVSLYRLIKFKPEKIIYYETYSSWPVYMYSRFFSPNVDVYIHFHEYFDKKWYDSAMQIVKWYHKFEITYLFKKAKWISHTNSDRIKLFLSDNPSVEENKMRILTNYPPKNWSKFKKEKLVKDCIKTVYVGALSLSDTYIENYCNWVISKNGQVLFDIYSYNLHDDTKTYLKSLNTDYITYHEKGVEYEDLPEILSQYDIGLILYKALSLNYKYNAPNKLFEYLAANLNVWFADCMLGIKPYVSSRVIAVDFDNLLSCNIEENNNNGVSDFEYDIFTAEKALEPLINKLIQ
jgi:hypothetical protein